MTDLNGTLVIIPALNEEKTILRVIGDVRHNYPNMDILVVNDGSSDRTGSLASGNGVRVISLPTTLGYGCALQTGYKFALRNNYNYAVQLDGDAQHDPKYIATLLDEVKSDRTDLAIGSRFLGENHYKMSFPRRMGIVLFRSLVSLITRQKVTDPTSGYQAMNRKVLEAWASHFYPVDYPDADVLIMLHKMGLRFSEVPVAMYPSADRGMHSGLTSIYYVFKMLLSILVTFMRKNQLKRGG